MENHTLEKPHTLHGKPMIQKEKTYHWKKMWIVTIFIVLPSDPPLTWQVNQSICNCWCLKITSLCTLGKHSPVGKSCIITSNEASVTCGGLITTSVTVGKTHRDRKCALGCSALLRGKRECSSQAILGKIDRRAKVTLSKTGHPLNAIMVAGMVGARQAAR